MNKFTQRQALIRAAKDKIVHYVNKTGIQDPEEIAKNTELKLDFVKNILSQKEEILQVDRKIDSVEDEKLRRIKNSTPKLYRLRNEIVDYAKNHYDLNALTFVDIQDICNHFNYDWARTEVAYFLGYEPKKQVDITKMMDRYYQTEIQGFKHLSPEMISVKTGLTVKRINLLLSTPLDPLTQHELRDLTSRDWFKRQQEIKEEKKARYANLYEKLKGSLHSPISYGEMETLAHSLGASFVTVKKEITVLRKVYAKEEPKTLSFTDFGGHCAISFVLPTKNLDDAFIALHQTLASVFPLYKQSLGRISQKRRYEKGDVIVCAFLFDKPVNLPTLNSMMEYWGRHQSYEINAYPHMIDGLSGLDKLLTKEDCVFKWFDNNVLAKPKTLPKVDVVLKEWQNKKELRQKAINYYYAQMRDKHAQEIAYETGYTYQHILKIMSNLPKECPSLTDQEWQDYRAYFKEEIDADIIRKQKAEQVDDLIKDKILDKALMKEVVAKTGKTASYIYSRAKTLEFISKPDAEKAELIELKSMLNKALALVEKALSKN